MTNRKMILNKLREYNAVASIKIGYHKMNFEAAQFLSKHTNQTILFESNDLLIIELAFFPCFLYDALGTDYEYAKEELDLNGNIAFINNSVLQNQNPIHFFSSLAKKLCFVTFSLSYIPKEISEYSNLIGITLYRGEIKEKNSAGGGNS